LGNWHGDIRVEAIDLQGRKTIVNFNTQVDQQHQIQVTTDHLTPGMYLFILSNAAGDILHTPWISVIR
jgi:hypothetical protein